MIITDEKETEFIDFDLLLSFYIEDFKTLRSNNL